MFLKLQCGGNMKFSLTQRTREQIIDRYNLDEGDIPGLLGEVAGNDSYKEALEKAHNVKAKKVAEYEGWHNLTGTGKIEVFEYEKEGESRFFCEFCYRISIDDYLIISYIFDHLPEENEIIKLHDNVLK